MYLALSLLFFFNDTATTEIYTLSLHDALPILSAPGFEQLHHPVVVGLPAGQRPADQVLQVVVAVADRVRAAERSEEHTSELQSRQYLVCRLLLEKKKKNNMQTTIAHTLKSINI